MLSTPVTVQWNQNGKIKSRFYSFEQLTGHPSIGIVFDNNTIEFHTIQYWKNDTRRRRRSSETYSNDTHSHTSRFSIDRKAGATTRSTLVLFFVTIYDGQKQSSSSRIIAMWRRRTLTNLSFPFGRSLLTSSCIDLLTHHHIAI